MPIYEYECKECRKKSSILTLRVSEKVDPKCDHCGSSKMQRLISRVRIVRSEESRMERLADPSTFSGVDENDPRSMVKWMKRMGHEMGEDLGEDFGEMVEEAEVEAEKGAHGEVEGSKDDTGGGEPPGSPADSGDL